MSRVERDRTAQAAVELPPEERAWLDEQLATYLDLLDYLHEQ